MNVGIGTVAAQFLGWAMFFLPGSLDGLADGLLPGKLHGLADGLESISRRSG
jgi:hypothetical protein